MHRSDFPILAREVYGKPLVYLDNAATTQKPRAVVDAISEEYYNTNANVHRGVHYLSQQATELHEAAREEVRRFMINREPICIEDHLDFCRSLKFRREKVYYLILAGGRVAGSVNFEWIAGSTLERGIWITRDFRRQGIAGKLLPEVYAELHRRLGVKKIFTEVMTGNEASNALERKLGARLVATRKDMN